MAANLELVKPKKESFFQKNSKFIKIFIVPIFSFLLFLGILFLLLIPQLQSVVSNANEISDKNEEIAEKNDQLDTLDALFARTSELSNQLSEINSITSPGDTKIVQYRDRVTDLAIENNLTILSEQLSEIVQASLPTADTTAVNNLSLQEVPAIFEMSGSLEDMTAFLEALDTLPDFVVVKEFEFSLSDETTVDDFRTAQWSLEIQLVKYQFQEAGEEQLVLFQNVAPSAVINPEVESYLNSRQQTDLDFGFEEVN